LVTFYLTTLPVPRGLWDRLPEAEITRGQLFPCYYGYIQGFVEANGDVLLCPSTTDRVLGNINDTRFREIWRRPENQLLRMRATQIPETGDALSPYCYGCPNVQYHSLAFHNIYSKIPALTGLLRKRIDRLTKAIGPV